MHQYKVKLEHFLKYNLLRIKSLVTLFNIELRDNFKKIIAHIIILTHIKKSFTRLFLDSVRLSRTECQGDGYFYRYYLWMSCWKHIKSPLVSRNIVQSFHRFIGRPVSVSIRCFLSFVFISKQKIRQNEWITVQIVNYFQLL